MRMTSSFRRLAVAAFASLLSFSGFAAFAAKGPQPEICVRACWGARAGSCSGNITSLTRAIIHHTAGSAGDFTTDYESAKSKVRSIQNYHMDSNGWCDVGYHFLVSGGGHIFEARANSMTGMPRGAHDGCNANSFGFTAMGYYHTPHNHQFTATVQNALYSVIAWRMPSTWSPYGSGTYCSNTVGFLDGHRKVKATACPGDIIWAHIGNDYNGGNARNGVFERKNPPITPSALQATVVSTSQINLSWTDHSNVEYGFKIERSTSSVGPWTQIATNAANVKVFSNTGLSINTTYYYRVRAHGALGDSAYSNTAFATTQGPGPTINQHPQTQTKDPGQNVTFAVSATGSGALSYQWRKNGDNLSNGGRVSGATSATLTIAAVEASDVGAYTVRVTDTLGTTASAEAQLFLNAIVIFQDTFTSNLDSWITVDSPATPLVISTTNHTPGGNSKSAQLSDSKNKMYRNFTPEIEGRARATFWMYDNMGSQTRWFSEVRSYTGSGFNDGGLLQLFAVGRYSVGFGTPTGTLAGETVSTTKYQGRIVVGPNSGWFNLNTTRSAGWHKFEIERAADGTTIHFYVDGVLDRTITGATYSPWDSVTVGSLGNQTHTTVTGDSWFDDIKLEYFNAPTITTHPTGQTRNMGNSVTFTVGATNNVEGYQWRFEGVDISGATNSAYTRSNLQAEDAGAYSVVVRNRAGTVTSSNAALAVNLPPAILEQPEDVGVRKGGSATFTVTATGTGPLSYQWFFDGSNIAGATLSQLSLTNVSTNLVGLYSVRVTNMAGLQMSDPAALTILPPQALEFDQVEFSEGGLQFTVYGEPGVEYVVQTSSNLLHWETLTNIVFTEEGNSSFNETVTNHPSLFFRAFQLEP